MKYRSYSDYFFSHYLGVKSLSVLDYSDYENANIIHDLNYLIPDTLVEHFDVVVDGGTLEHIFNFPTAIKNCMMMVKRGGSIFVFSMANNHCGHGFYQFSPELFYRIFEKDNGFQIKNIILVKHPFPGAELSEKQQCFKVKDPMIVGRRSSLVTKSPLGIMVHATKISSISVFINYPNQSDYQNKWKKNNYHGIYSNNNNKFKDISKLILSKFPLKFKLWLKGCFMLMKFNLKRDSEFYQPWS